MDFVDMTVAIAVPETTSFARLALEALAFAMRLAFTSAQVMLKLYTVQYSVSKSASSVIVFV